MLIGDGSGGLTADDLQANAKKYFASSMSTSLSDLETAELAAELRKQAIAQGASVEQLVDVTVEALVTLSQSTSMEITALTVPCPANSNIAVSMYGDDKAKGKQLPVNARATALARACGHGEALVNGDVFVSRYHDDENADIWDRTDFTIEDSLPEAKWCSAGGGGKGKGSGGSLSSMFGKQANVMDMGKTAAQQSAAAAALDTSEKEGDDFRWSQSVDDVELRVPVDGTTTSKTLDVKFGANSLSVNVKTGVSPMSNEKIGWEKVKLGGPVIIDDCTWSLEKKGEGKELVISLGKQTGGITWSFPLEK